MSSSLCRVCLEGNVRLLKIENDLLLEVYEKLTSSKLNNADGRMPTKICYICVSQLQRCHRFYNMVCESTKTLTHLLQNGIEVTQENVTALSLDEPHHLITTAIQHMTVTNCSVYRSQARIKPEDITVKEETDDCGDFIENEESGLVSDEEITLFDDLPSYNQNIDHLGQESNDMLHFYCDMCLKKCPMKGVLMKLKKIDTGEELKACNRCVKELKSFNKDRVTKPDHLEQESDDNMINFNCDLCKKNCPMKEVPIRLQKIDTGEELQSCNRCVKALKGINKDGVTNPDHLEQESKDMTHFDCDMCKKKWYQKGVLLRLKKIDTGEELKACHRCVKALKSCDIDGVTNLDHLGQASDDMTHFNCDMCKKNCPMEEVLIKLQKIDTGEELKACNRCVKALKGLNKDGVTKPNHLEQESKDMIHFNCDMCNKKWYKKGALLRLQIKDTGEKLKVCNICVKSLTKPDHLGQESDVIITFKCDLCKKNRPMNEVLRILQKIDTGEELKVCNRCVKSFRSFNKDGASNPDHLEQESNDTRHFSCDMCKKIWFRKGFLLRLQKKDTDEELKACKICIKALRSFNEDGVKLPKKLVRPRKKTFACKVCSKVFNRSTHLKRHMLIHTEKQYVCNICSMAFYRPQQLLQHMRIHNGQKPYACNKCNKAYSKYDHLKRHMLIHTGEKPYACLKCSMAFREAGCLKKHIVVIHSGGKKP